MAMEGRQQETYDMNTNMNTDTDQLTLLTRLLNSEPYDMPGVALCGACIGPYGRPVKTYDDGSGPLWAYGESYGVRGLVRADTFADTWECVLDEILTPISEEDVPEAYGLLLVESANNTAILYDDEARPGEYRRVFESLTAAQEECNRLMVDRDLAEGYEYQPNATGTGIVQRDLNHNNLVPVTQEYLDAQEIELILEEI